LFPLLDAGSVTRRHSPKIPGAQPGSIELEAS
jgi:hypothetical protein